MKHLLTVMLSLCLILGLSLLPESSQAQDNLKANSAGTYTAQMNFTPFSAQPLSINRLQFRYFNDESTAYRMGVNLGYRSFQDDPDPNFEISGGVFDLSLIPGIEFHASGTNRFSPYYGAEVEIAFRRVSATERENIGGNVTETEYSGLYNGNRGFMQFGARALIGFDLYVVRNLYVGAEFGYGFMYEKDSDIVVKEGAQTFEQEGMGSFRLGTTFNPAIRLGWAFL